MPDATGENCVANNGSLNMFDTIENNGFMMLAVCWWLCEVSPLDPILSLLENSALNQSHPSCLQVKVNLQKNTGKHLLEGDHGNCVAKTSHNYRVSLCKFPEIS